MVFAIINLGLCSIIWQFVLLRELQSSFQGNELSISVIFFCWLSGTGLGGLLSKYFLTTRSNTDENAKNTYGFGYMESQTIALPAYRLRHRLSLIFFLNSLLCFISLFLSRSLKLFLSISPFEILQPLEIFYISSIAILPQTICLGISFILICYIIRNPLKVYSLEAIGAFLAGLSTLILANFDSTQAIWLISILFLISSCWLGQRNAHFRLILIITFIFYLLLPVTGLLTEFQNYTNGLRFRPEKVVNSLNSIYANITITANNGQYNLYENGKLSFTSLDTEALEEFAHMILLNHPSPRKILVIGQGASGLIAEIIKHPIESLDYVEPNSKLLNAILKYIPQSKQWGLSDKRVHIYNQDARAFVKTTLNKYDLAILNSGDPANLQQNRFYTVEFFREIKQLLNPDGKFNLSFGSKEDILIGQMLKYNGSLYKSVKSVFNDVKIIPGERIILICSQQNLAQINAGELIQRFGNRKIMSTYFTPEHIRAKLFRQDYVQKRLNDGEKAASLNRDYSPYGFFYYLGLWGKQSWLNFNRIWGLLSRWNLTYWLILTLIFVSIFRRNVINISIFSSGFSAIALEIIISFIFQIHFGFLYYRLGTIVASFMLGLSLGSLGALRLLKIKGSRMKPLLKRPFGIPKYDFFDSLHSGSPLKAVFYLEISLAIASIIIYPVLKQIQLSYFLISLIVGLLVGLEFGIFYSQRKTNIVFTLDLLGACAGSLCIGLIFIPVLGIFKTCLGISLTKLIVAAFLRRQVR